MAIAYVGENLHSAAQISGSTTALSITTAPAAGDLLLLSVSTGGGFTSTSVTDSKGNTWSQDKTVTQNDNIAVYSTLQDVGTLTTSDTITVHFSGTLSSTHCAFTCDEFSGATKTVDQSSSSTHSSSTTARDAGSVTTLNASDLLFAAYEVVGTETSFTATAGYSTPTTAFYGVSVSVERQYQIVTSTGVYGSSAIGGLSAKSGGVIVAYKAAAAAAASLITDPRRSQHSGANPHLVIR